MSQNTAAASGNDGEGLSEEWMGIVVNASHNLGFEHVLSMPSSEHWPMVLTSIAAWMKIRRVAPPFGWKDALARQAGRHAD